MPFFKQYPDWPEVRLKKIDAKKKRIQTMDKESSEYREWRYEKQHENQAFTFLCKIKNIDQ